ncbi:MULTISPECIES: cytochrome b [Agrobacterium]|uniref:cytochrome b n=1 Tax=Agrobacterium TaxID=357 RepID=UPI0022B835CB|nr:MULTISPECIES: cytochrome b/b6 domain-containing protein [Agrobacterium]MCZ7889457.1 cytochrome b/b6 domain-containing protein [Agrobacterium salinitolerans]MDA5630845.1 cytochrome b/b6 domain-containing protein [Agrobacterium sp. ST15.16.055]MDA6981682.1 cytochrome b/b6 domain-containing protein [Agrobacterium salinitolerans]
MKSAIDTDNPKAVKYPLPIRCLHWVRAALIIGLIASGWYMTRLPESDMVIASIFYPNHKQFGILVWLLALVHLALRSRYATSMPPAPSALAPWERILSHAVHKLLILLTLLVPLLGYSLSSSFSQSDGVPFFFIPHLPELLPKNDNAFIVFQTLHRYGAYAILVLIGVHVLGALKHRRMDKGGPTDVLSRMV